MGRLIDVSLLRVTSIANLAATNKLNPYEPMVLLNASDITQVPGTTKPSQRLVISNNDSTKTSGIVAGDLNQIASVSELVSLSNAAIKRIIDPTPFSGSGTVDLNTASYNTFYLTLTGNLAFDASMYNDMAVGQECTFFMLASGAERTFAIPTGTSHWKNAVSVVIASGKTKEISLYKRSATAFYWQVSEELGNV